MMLHKIPSNSFREKFLPVCLCGGSFISVGFFFRPLSLSLSHRCRVCPNRFARIRGMADTVAIMGIERGWPPSCHLATFCLFFFLSASLGLLCHCLSPSLFLCVCVCVAISIYNTRSFTLSDSLGVYSYPLSCATAARTQKCTMGGWVGK